MTPILSQNSVLNSNNPYIYPYVLNNPLRFVDPSGYRPVGIFEEEALMNNNGGGPSGSWDPFGWISRGMSMAGWTDMTGPNLSQWHYWNDNVKGNPLNGESANEFTTWYRMMRYGNSNQQTEDWANAIEFGINSSADVTTVNRYGVSTLNLFEDTPIAAYLLFGMNLDLSDTNYLINLLASNDGGGLPTVDGVTAPWSIEYMAEKSLEIGSHPFTGLAFDVLEYTTGFKGFKKIGYVASGFAFASDSYQYFVKQNISLGRYGYRMGSTGMALGLSLISSPAAPFIGSTTMFAEWAYDAIKYQYENLYMRVNSYDWWGSKFMYGY